MVDFRLPEQLDQLRSQVREFVDSRVIPAESAVFQEDRESRRDTLTQLRAQAKEAGLWTPHLPEDMGGKGLGIMGMCALFREMGRSPIGAKVFNCDAPDQGNMSLLLTTASEPLKARYLKPLVDGEITSGFCMTEPAPGAGSDPQNLRTRAEKDGDDWVINGHKWYTTGGDNAAFLIVMARTSEDRRTGCTMFIVDRHAEGVELVRNIPVMAPDVLDHLEAEFKFNNVRVSKDAVLLDVGQGFRLAQVRLVPARLTHCMRWLGLAERTLSMCREYISERQSFGKPLAEHQAVQRMLADNALAIHAGNLMTLHCAQMIEQGAGRESMPYSSMAKNHVAQLLCKTLDDAIQMHGGKGYSHDLPFAHWYASARAARIADGPDEVHQMVIAKSFLKGQLELLV